MDTEITGPWICPLAQKHFSHCLGQVPPTFLPGCINSRGRFWWRVMPEMYMGLQKASMKMYVLICKRTEGWMGSWSLPSTDYSQVDDHVGRPGQSGQSGIRQRIDLGKGVTRGGRDSVSGQRNWAQEALCRGRQTGQLRLARSAEQETSTQCPVLTYNFITHICTFITCLLYQSTCKNIPIYERK